MRESQGERSDALSARLSALLNHGHISAWVREGARWRIVYNDGTSSEWREDTQMESFVGDMERGFGVT